MTEYEELSVPGHVSTRKASEILGVSYDRVYQYVKENRLPARMVSHRLMIPIEAVENYKRGRLKPVGRTRKKPPGWRTYRGGGKVSGTEIQVCLRPGQYEKLLEKLREILEGQEHLLTGSITRYILRDRANPDLITIWLAWKDTEMPDEEQHEWELDAFKDRLDDVLDWSTAVINEKDGIIYT